MGTKSVLTVAKSQIGVKESPANSNNVKYNTWYYGKTVNGSSYPWCAVFIAWCFKEAGVYNNIKSVPNKAYCPSYEEWAKKNNRWHTNPKVGYLALFDWGLDGVADHIGIVEKIIDSKTIQTIEGNTGVGNDSNGGQVMRRIRSTKYVKGYVGVTIYPVTEKKTYQGSWWKPTVSANSKSPDNIKKWQSYLCWYGLTVSKDGSFGPDTLKKTKMFQKENGLIEDGKVGPATTQKAKTIKK